jgi:TonB family protein
MRWRPTVTIAVVSIFTLLAVVGSRSQQPNTHSDVPDSQPPTTAGNLEVLTDTKGFDFGPYLSNVVATIRKNWYSFIPEEARPPQLKSGVTTIQFAILRDGKIAGIRITHPAGSTPLDRAAWGGITASHPFAPLPEGFKGDYLPLRMSFSYNPAKNADPSFSSPSSAESNESPPVPY